MSWLTKIIYLLNLLRIIKVLLAFSFAFATQEVVYAQEPLLDSTQVYSWNDTIVSWEKMHSKHFNYNLQGDLVIEIYREKKSWGSYYNTEKTEYQIDSSGDIISTIRFHYTNFEWKAKFKWEYLYDSLGGLATSYFYDVFGTSWKEKNKTEYAYDLDGRMTSSVHSNWTGGWNLSERYIWAYDGLGNETVYGFDNWTGWGWSRFEQTLSVYDGMKKVSQRNQIDWGNGLEDVDRYTWAYDSLNFLQSEEYDTYFAPNWSPEHRIGYQRDALGNLLQSQKQNYISSAWKDVSRESFTYDARHRLSIHTSENFIFSQSAWQNEQLEHFGWNNFDQLTFESLRLWNQDSLHWGRADSTRHFYGTMVGLGEQASFSEYSLFPNPMHESITLSSSGNNERLEFLKVYDISGRQVHLQRDVQLPYKLDGTSFNSGIYLMVIGANGQSPEVIKFIVE